MFKDKHVVIALLVAPILAIIAWYAVEHLVAEDPHAAVAGAAYSMVAKSNCRYASGRCDLENGEFKIRLRAAESQSSNTAVLLETETELQGAHIGLVIAGVESTRVSLERSDENDIVWITDLALPAVPAELRVVAQANDALWYATVPTIFLSVTE